MSVTNEHKKSLVENSSSILVVSVVIRKFEKFIFWALLFLLPILIIPTKLWIFDVGRVLFLHAGVIVLAFLEIVHVILSKRFSFVKASTDWAVWGLLISFVLSSLLALDLNVSLVGVDYRLGVGLWAILSLVVLSFIAKSIIETTQDLTNTVLALLGGISLSALLSSLSYWGVNIYVRVFDIFKYSFVEGMTTFSKTIVSLSVWSTAILLSLGFLVSSGKRNRILNTLLGMLFTGLNLVAFILFSAGGQSLAWKLLLLIMIFVFVLLVLSKGLLTIRYQKIVFYVTALIVVISLLLSFIPIVNKRIATTYHGRAIQRALPRDVSWTIAVSSLANNSAKTALFGMGNDMFEIAYNRYRPAFYKGVDLTQGRFFYAGNEILTTLTNRGVLGDLVWLFIAYLVVVALWKDWRSRSIVKEVHLLLLALDIALVYLVGLLFFTYFDIYLFFLLFVLLSLRVVAHALLDPRAVETFVIEFNFFVERIGSQTVETVQYVLLGLVTIALVFASVLYSKSVMSYVYTIKGELLYNKLLEEVANTDKNNPISNAEKRNVLGKVASYYNKAIINNNNNYVFHRSLGLVSMDFAGVVANDLKKTEKNDKDRQAALQKLIKQSVELSISSIKKATELEPNIYTNWQALSIVYTQLVQWGSKDYADVALRTLDTMLSLNPSNYLAYYTAANVYLIKQDTEGALRALDMSLQINGAYIPSLILSANLYEAQGHKDVALVYLKRVKSVLEQVKQTNSDLYKNVSDKVDALSESVEKSEK